MQLQVGHIVEEVQLCVPVQQQPQICILPRKGYNKAPQQNHMLLQPQMVKFVSKLWRETSQLLALTV